LQLEAEARAGIYRLYCSKQWKCKSEGYGHAYISRGMREEPILLMETDKIIPRHVDYKSFTLTFPERSEMKDAFQPDLRGGLSGVQTVLNEDTRNEVCGYGLRRKPSFSLGQYTTVFQAELYAITACTVEI
jgi:hypothetical protein